MAYTGEMLKLKTQQINMKNKITQKSIRFPTELVELIQKIAKIEKRKFSNEINKIIEDHFNNISTKNVDNTNKYYCKEIIDLINEWQKT